jgi:hypothetical protein
MRRFSFKGAMFGALSALTLLGGCATVEDVERAQKTADNALATANSAQSAANDAHQAAAAAMAQAQTAQQTAQDAKAGADRALADLGESKSQIAALMEKHRRGERD